MFLRKAFHLAIASLLLTSCSEMPDFSLADKDANQSAASSEKLALRQVAFTDLPNWQTDRQDMALQAFAKSCAKIEKRKAEDNFSGEKWSGRVADWQQACRNRPQGAVTSAQARDYFQNNFTPYAASDNGDEQGLFTGYFEASLNGSNTKTGAYQIPLRAKPDDLVMVDLGAFRDELKGQRIAGRVVNGSLKPYEDRAAIETGKLPAAQDKPLLYVDNAVDAFFLQIQGSGIVTLPDGSVTRVGYDGQNGHPYYAIGKELVKRGALKQGEVSMQSIKAWLAAHPDEATEVMRTNKSYVFFRKIEGDGPIGGEGTALTPERSLAVDRKFTPYGVPVFLHTDNDVKIDRLMVAQDTGGAIRGAVRGDVFFGHGPDAERKSGPMQAKGRYWFLLPKSVNPNP